MDASLAALLEVSPYEVDDGHVIGRDPRKIPAHEFDGLELVVALFWMSSGPSVWIAARGRRMRSGSVLRSPALCGRTGWGRTLSGLSP
jgi:hypothetical protein